MNRKCFFVLVLVVGLLWLQSNQFILVKYVENEDTLSKPISDVKSKSYSYAQYEPQDGLDVDDHMVCGKKILNFYAKNTKSNDEKVPDVFIATTEVATTTKSCICTGTPTSYNECFFEYTCKNRSSHHCVDCSGSPSRGDVLSTSDTIKILLYNNVNDDISIYRNEMVTQCSVKCKFEKASRSTDGYDGVIFSIIKYDGGLPKKHPGQQFIAHCGESIESYYGRHMRNPGYMANFDIQATYLQSANLHWNYMSFEYGPNTEKMFTKPVSYAQKSQKSPIVWISTNCNALNHREKIVEQIMKYIPVDSYGSCLHNKEFPFSDTRHGQGWEDRKMKVVSDYLFVLAFENSNQLDYVTEKFYHAFMAGAVPIYMGAPNIDEFSPGNHSFIKFSDFKSAEKLVEHLQLLIDNPHLYDEYHAWRKNGWSSSFIDLLPYTYHSLPCRVCEKVAELRSKSNKHLT